MGLDDIRLRIEMKIPDVFEQHCARHDAALVAHQIFQELEFARCRSIGAPARRTVRLIKSISRSAAVRTVPSLASGGRRASATRRAMKLGKCEGFDEIIVAACLQPLDAIVDPRQVSEKQNRRRHAGPAHHSDNGQAVQFRQHPVETIASCRSSAAISRPSEPLAAMSAAWPRASRRSRRNAAFSRSSSTINIFHRHSVGSVLRRFIQNMRAKTSSPSMACSAAMLA